MEVRQCTAVNGGLQKMSFNNLKRVLLKKVNISLSVRYTESIFTPFPQTACSDGEAIHGLSSPSMLLLNPPDSIDKNSF